MTKIEIVLAQCLEALEQGTSLEACLARYPNRREELEPLLRAAQRVGSAPPVGPSDTFRQGARDRMVLLIQHREALKARRETERRSGGFLERLRGQLAPAFQMGRLIRPAVALLALVLLVGVLGAGAVYASSDALPGSSLYPFKMASERIRLTLSFSESAKAALHLELAAERLEEASGLVQTDGDAEIEPLMKRYAAEVNAASGILQRRRDRDSQVTTLSVELQEELTRHQAVLGQVRESVPETARRAVERALIASEAARQGALGPEERPQASPDVKPTRPGRAGWGTGTPTSTRLAEPTATYTPTETSEPDQNTEPTERAVPRGWTRTPEPPGLTMTPEPPGRTHTPQPPGRTYTPAPPAQSPTPREPNPGVTPGPPDEPGPPEPPDPPDDPGPPEQDERPGPPGKQGTSGRP